MSQDEFRTSSNVTTLPRADRSTLAAAHLGLTTESIREAVVYNLRMKPKQCIIYWERDTGIYSHTKDFFRILNQQGIVSIWRDGDSITKSSILNVLDDDGSEYELPISYFIRLTADQPQAIEDVDTYIMTYFNDLGIQTRTWANNSSLCQTDLNRWELGVYKPEEIDACVLENESYYMCHLIYNEIEPIGYWKPKQFNCLETQVTLLDLIILCIVDTEDNGFSIDWASMEVSSFEGRDIVITSIPPELLHEVVFAAIKRTNPLYGNMSYDKAVTRYMDTVVIPKLRPMDDLDDEE